MHVTSPASIHWGGGEVFPHKTWLVIVHSLVYIASKVVYKIRKFPGGYSYRPPAQCVLSVYFIKVEDVITPKSLFLESIEPW